MKKNVYYQIKDDVILVTSPYNCKFNHAIINLGGVWDSLCRAWSLPLCLINEARKLMMSHYGETGEEERQTYRITATIFISVTRGPIRAGRKDICAAFGRDTGAKTFSGVSLVDGTIDSGGSAKWWTTKCYAGATFQLELTELQQRLIEKSDKWEIEKVDYSTEIEELNIDDYLD